MVAAASPLPARRLELLSLVRLDDDLYRCLWTTVRGELVTSDIQTTWTSTTGYVTVELEVECVTSPMAPRVVLDAVYDAELARHWKAVA